MMKRTRLLWQPVAGLLLGLAAAGCASGGPRYRPVPLPDIGQQVEIRRTEHGVPQILAANLRAAGFALAYVQLEDYGPRIIEGFQSARGRMALIDGVRRVDGDARARLRYARAVETFTLLKQDTRDVYEGFAAGMNHYIRVYRDRVPAWMQPDYTAMDVFARDVSLPADGAMNEFRERLAANPADPAVLVSDETGTWRRVVADSAGAVARIEWTEPDDNVGSNAWALAPSRTTTGRAILLRNPHLAWTAGYYEAHVRVPGKLDFYGDFRIGGPFTTVGGFNRYLGFSTTNNANRTHEFYAFRADSTKLDHILLDGVSVPLKRQEVSVEYRDSTGNEGSETREFWSSPLGPVVQRANGLVYVYRPAGDGEYRAGEQWLEMMKASSLAEWKDAMRMMARSTSNFTYADRDGNILYVWVSTTPSLPHPAGGDSLAILAASTTQVWSKLVPFDSLPQVLNPPGGYVHNENDSPHFTNLHHILKHEAFSYWVQEPSLRLRSQHAVEILHNDRKFSLEDVIVAKHSMRMLLADRVKNDLVAAVRGTQPEGEVARALELLASWDNTVAAESRGGLLFETWWNRYRSQLPRGAPAHAAEWTIDEPATTPRGLADPVRAAEAFAWAVPETARRYGSWDAAWGDVHRVRRGHVDVPVGGCSGTLGCFRVLNFSQAEDGKRVANGGDGWIIAVEFGEEPRAYSVLAYGQSPNPESPYYADQAAMFAANRMKPVRWSEEEIVRAAVRRYRPGEERRK